MIYHATVVSSKSRRQFEAALASRIDAIQAEGMRAEVQAMTPHHYLDPYAALVLAHQEVDPGGDTSDVPRTTLYPTD